ncbi:MAG: glucose 1-dehydrogenase [Desulfobacterales bacterium]|jgi:NAD(P)-dependent dehydrogenase (short-subunit alcohol dehydrogenase family)|nr:glucose 1-dehydrogenase [Desulfobacteraceae bacterium]MBT4363147.1 glucose 1-dehydrogenase [Desulfobacteraceae bacterium]MBT7087260.1 glucose 1-dehydrogenase [Desulfobacterales bacterium]MBT7698302.1 glucose 1-dehydrogenase [Desulfobacterales bacterium]
MKVQELFNLNGKVALITGGSKGLGYIMAEGLAEAGADIILCSRNIDECKVAADNISKIGVKSKAYKCDVSDPDDVVEMVESTILEFGKIDILINNAGYATGGPLEDMTLEQWNKSFAVNSTGPFLCCREVGRQMIKQGGGKIINIASVAGMTTIAPELADALSYSSSKAALVFFTKDLARKWCKYNINVNAIAPGYFSTEMSKNVIEYRNKEMMNTILMKRLGEKEDLKGAALLLSSKASDYMTGQIIAVDGGVLLS